MQADMDPNAQSNPRPESGPVSGRRFNMSRWALEHPALTRYLMVAMLVLGFAAYFQLGQDEDPSFTFRVMVVRASWPGATAEQVAEQARKVEDLEQRVAVITQAKQHLNAARAALEGE